MKTLPLILSLAALAGCAVPPPGPANYGTRAYNGDPSQWHVVSVTPVAPGTGAQAAAAGDPNNTASPVVESAQAPAVAAQPAYPAQPVYVQQPIYAAPPVYVQQPVYVPQPVYDPYPYYWWPPISIGLGFSWFHGDHGHGGWGGGGHGGWGGGHGGWHGGGHRGGH